MINFLKGSCYTRRILLSILILALFVAASSCTNPAAPCQCDHDSVAEPDPKPDETSNGFRIVLDAGHGGPLPGTDGFGNEALGRKEKDDNLRMVLAVGPKLKAYKFEVFYTRTEDVAVSLADRASFANLVDAHAVVSIHRNYYSGASIGGLETYVYKAQGATTGELESNSGAGFLARKIQQKIIAAVQMFSNRGVKQDNYLLLRETNMPAVHIELGFIQNVSDNQYFDEYFDEIAQAIADAIAESFGIPLHN